jgi:hypothetical protein
MRTLTFTICLLVISLFLSCRGGTNKIVPQSQSISSITIEKFDDFYNKFKSDSAFRNERILFPLKGYNSDDAEETLGSKVEYTWEKKMLSYCLSMKHQGEEYKTKIEKTDNLVKETIYIEGSGYKIISNYILKENKWYLDYYFYQNE